MRYLLWHSTVINAITNITAPGLEFLALPDSLNPDH